MIATETISLRVKLGAAIATAESPITGHYVTMTNAGVVIGVQAIHSVTNGVTPVIITPNALSGYVNVLKNLQVSNADSATISVILEQWDGTTARTMSSSPLAINQFLTVDNEGRITVSATGGIAGTGTVTQVQGNGTVNGLSLSGNITTSGNITLGGTLNGTAPALTAGNVTNMIALSGAVTGNSTGATVLTPNGFSSANLSTALTDKTGTGLNVFANNCTLNTPNLTTPSFANLSSAIGLNLTSGVSGILPFVNGGVEQGAWTSYTPTLANITLGNGVLSCAYQYLNKKTIAVRFQLTAGTTTFLAAGVLHTFTLPAQVAAGVALKSQIGGLLFYDLSVPNLYKGSVILETNPATPTAGLYIDYANFTYVYLGAIQSGLPVLLNNGDVISACFFYEVA